VNTYQPNTKLRDADIFPCAVQITLIYSVNTVYTHAWAHTDKQEQIYARARTHTHRRVRLKVKGKKKR
jgi:hypothetical protein